MVKRKKYMAVPRGNVTLLEEKKESMQVQRNLVAKFAKTYNKAHCHLDKKAALKRGKVKHKQQFKMRDMLKESKLINFFF